MSNTTRGFVGVFVGTLALGGLLNCVLAQSGNHPSAEESDPRVLGWMQGFPPPPDRLIMQPESDFFSFPKLRWTVCHIRELMPTRGVHGQTIYVDPAAEMVLVRFASFPTAKNAKIDPTSLPAYQAVAQYLMEK